MSKSLKSVTVLQYLKTQNRPFSVNDIVSNLHNEYGKGEVQKALDSLVKDEKVREKVYGKQKVYFIDQSTVKETSSTELSAMDGQIEDLERTMKETETNLKATQIQLKELNNTLTTKEAQDQVSKVTKEVDDLQAKYNKLSETTVMIDVGERDELRKKREGYMKEWRVRKRRCLEMLGDIFENYPKSKQSLYEEIGVETDEDVNVIMPK